MEVKLLNTIEGEKKSLDDWAIIVFMPILEAISFIVLKMEAALTALD